MKTNFRIVSLAGLVLWAASVSAAPAIAERNEQFRVWENIQAVTNELGEVSFTTNRWTELANGICYKDPLTGEWRDSEALVEAHPLGAIAQRSPHTVMFARDITTPGSIDILLPDRHSHLRGHPLGLYFYDALDGKSQLIATIASAVGEILAPNKVIYRGAFGVMADLVYVCERGSVTACVVLRQKPALPAGFNAEFARLSVVTEWLDAPVPKIKEQIIWREDDPALRARMFEPDLIDQYLDFGSMQMILGKAFSAKENFDMRVPSPSDIKIAKRWTEMAGRRVLLESAVWSAIEPSLVGLPISKEAAVEGNPSVKLEQILPALKATNASGGEMKMALAKLPGRGFILDYTTVYPASNFTFSKDETYLVPYNVSYGLSGTTTIQGGTVVKYDLWCRLYCTGPVVCDTADNFAVFTSKDDSSTGEPIGSGNPTGYRAWPALWLYYVDTPQTFKRLHFAWCQYGLWFDSNQAVNHTVIECSLDHCDTGVWTYTPTATLDQLFMCSVTTPYTPTQKYTVGTITYRCDPLVNDPKLDGGSTPLTRKQGESSIVLCSGGLGSRLVVGYIDDTNSFKRTGYSQSSDGGVSFVDKGGMPSDADGQGNGVDPALAFKQPTPAMPNGRLYFATNPNQCTSCNPPRYGDRIRLFRSDDEGDSFGAPVNVGESYFLDNDLLDKPWLAVDNFTASGNGNVYLIFLNNWPSSQSQQQSKGVYFYRSLNHGDTWSDLYFFPGTGDSADVHFPFITVAPNHSVYAFYYQKSSQSIQGRRGAAQGTSWSSLPTIGLSSSGGFGGSWFLDIRASSAPGAAVVRNVCALQAAANPVRSGDIYLVYPDQSTVAGDKADIFFAVLLNGASSWTTPVRVNNPGNTTTPDNDQWNPVIAIKPNGTQLFVGYYDRSTDSNNTLIHAAGRIGSIDGNGNVAFGPRIQVSAANFPVVTDGQSEADYDAATADDSTFYYAWTDNRNRMKQGGSLKNEANVRFSKIASP